MSADNGRSLSLTTRTAGGRLVPPARRAEQANPHRRNALTSGHRACQGCGVALAARTVVDAAYRASGGKLVVVTATGCLEVFSTPYPESAWRVPWLHSLFANAASVASGVAAALYAQGREDVRVLAQGGDGATVDIGLACLSGMFERGDDVLYVCYDNEAYMNTGIQRSGATPPYARTATTEAVGGEPGNPPGTGKDLPRIALAHSIPYVATATIGDIHDLEAKVVNAMGVRGPRYLHVLTPCPLGWGSGPAETIALARLAQRSGLFPVFEARDGDITSVLPIRRPVPVEEYLRPQRRFAHLFADPDRRLLTRLQEFADSTKARYGLM